MTQPAAEQRTPAWFAARKHKVTGSQAGAILGLSPWKSREDCMQDWLFGSTFEGNQATEYGTFHESLAQADYELEHGVKVQEEGFVIHPDYDWIGASPDGLVGEDIVLEIKCPYGLRDKKDPAFKRIEDQPHYYAQLQLEMACTGRNICHFYQWNRFKSDLQVVEFNQDWWNVKIIKFYEFMADFEQRKLEIGDDEQLAIRYHIIKDEFNAAKAELDEMKEKLIKRANGQKRKFGDVSVYPVERKGSVSYAKVVKENLPDLDLTKWMGEPSTSWIVK